MAYLLLSNPLPNEKILDQSKFKALIFADDKLKVIQMSKFVLDKTESIVRKEENAGLQNFLLFPQCFLKKKKKMVMVVKSRSSLVRCFSLPDDIWRQSFQCCSYGAIFVAFDEDKATLSSIPYFENRVSYFVQNRRM